LNNQLQNTEFKHLFKSIPYSKRLILWLLVFNQYYALGFKFLPFTTRVGLGLFGLLLLLIEVIKTLQTRNDIFINKKIIPMCIFFLLMALTTIVSINYNGTNDIDFIVYPSTPILMLFSAYFIMYYFKKFYGDKLCFSLIAYYLIVIVVVQLMISIGMYISPAFQNFLFGLLKPGAYVDAHETASSGRLLGFGSNFMNLAVANCFALILISVLLKNATYFKLSPFYKNLLAFFFIFLSVLGLMQARTTMMGSLLGVGYMLFSSFKFTYDNLKNGFLKLLVISATAGFLILLIVVLFPEFLEGKMHTLNYGFELFNNYSQSGKLTTGSSAVLESMYSIWPKTNKTWLIGDGRFFNVPNDSGSGFYMNTDIGYARLVFYLGLVGMLLFCFFEYKMISQAFFPFAKVGRSTGICMLFIIYIINGKSFTEVTTYIALFWIFNLTINPQKDSEFVKYSI
jgi:hypothetical protein